MNMIGGKKMAWIAVVLATKLSKIHAEILVILYSKNGDLGSMALLDKMYQYDAYLASMVVSLPVFFLFHYLQNGAFVWVHRTEYTEVESHYIPNWAGLKKTIKSWIPTWKDVQEGAQTIVTYYGRHDEMLSLAFIGSCFALITIVPPIEMVIFWGIGLTLCVGGLMSESIWRPAFKPYFPVFYLGTVMYCVPFLGILIFLSTPCNPAGIYLILNTVLLFTLGVSGGFFAYIVAYLLGYQAGFMANPGVLVAFGVLLLILWVFGKHRDEALLYRVKQSKLWSGGLGHELKSSTGMMKYQGIRLEHQLDQGNPTVDDQHEEGVFLKKKQMEVMRDIIQELSTQGKYAEDDIKAFINIIQKDVIQQADLKPVNIRSMIDEAIDRIKGKYDITVSYENDEDLTADLPIKLFPLVIYNLIKNAYWHGQADTMKIRVDAENRKVFFRDNGNGIPQEAMPRLFDLFYTKGASGSGIGLYFVKEVVRAAGGTVFCKSSTKKGQSFTEFEIGFKENKAN